MRLIDADRLKAKIMGWHVVLDDLFDMGKYHEREIVLQAIEESPAVDAVPVVRCRECANAKLIDKNESVYTCTHPQWTRRSHNDTFEESQLFHGLDGNDFCSYGVKMESEVKHDG